MAGLRRTVNDPTYAFPWHRGGLIVIIILKRDGDESAALFASPGNQGPGAAHC